MLPRYDKRATFVARAGRRYPSPSSAVKLVVAVILTFLLTLQWSYKNACVWSSGETTAVADSATAPRIAIVTFITSQVSYLHLSLKNKKHYANRHGYDLFVEYESHATRGMTWLKFDMIEQVIRAGKHDWVWWIDFDTLITNTSMPVTDVIDDSLAGIPSPELIDALVTYDCNGLNDGSFIMRSTQRSIDFLNGARDIWEWGKKNEDVEVNDQDAMEYLLKSKHKLSKYAMTIPAWTINAFPEEINCPDWGGRFWQPGDLLVHFAGAWAHIEDEDATGLLMRRYEPQIIWGEHNRTW